jgi:hypothetical protein
MTTSWRWALAFATAASAFGQVPAVKEAIVPPAFRQIGPANPGGRIDDIAVVESDPCIMYAETTADGMFQAVNGGPTTEFQSEELGVLATVVSELESLWKQVLDVVAALNRSLASSGAGLITAAGQQ